MIRSNADKTRESERPNLSETKVENLSRKHGQDLASSDPLDVLGEKGTREDVRGAIYSKRLGATERRAIEYIRI